MAHACTMIEASSLDVVVQRLAACKGRWQQVAVESGVPYWTLSKIARGTTKNPRLRTVERLHHYLRGQLPA